MKTVSDVKNLNLGQAGRTLFFQIVTTLLIAALALISGKDAALSALLGGAIATIGNALFALWIFGHYRAQDPGKLLLRFYGAELLKIVAILGMFAAVFYWVESIMPVVFMLAFLVSQVLPPMLAHGSSA